MHVTVFYCMCNVSYLAYSTLSIFGILSTHIESHQHTTQDTVVMWHPFACTRNKETKHVIIRNPSGYWVRKQERSRNLQWTNQRQIRMIERGVVISTKKIKKEALDKRQKWRFMMYVLKERDNSNFPRITFFQCCTAIDSLQSTG
jgi:hypothetical protein